MTHYSGRKEENLISIQVFLLYSWLFLFILISFLYMRKYIFDYLLYRSLKEQSNSSMMKSTSIAIMFTYLMYTLTGILGYLMYPNKINALIIINFEKDIVKYLIEGRIFLCFLLTVVIIAFIVALILTIPMVFHGAKKHFLNLVLFTKRKHRHLFLKGIKITKRESLIVTIVLYCFILIITLSVENVMLFFNFIGSTTACSISFILPAVFLLKLLQINRIKSGKISAIIVLIMGIFGLLSFYLPEFIKLIID